MPEPPASENAPSRLLDLVNAYTQPRRDDDLGAPGAEGDGDAATAKGKAKAVKSRRRHGSAKARRRPRTHTP